MSPRTLRRILFPALAVLVAAFAWWWEHREEERQVPHHASPAVPLPGPDDPNPMRMSPILPPAMTSDPAMQR